jgi:hypothetical protein
MSTTENPAYQPFEELVKSTWTLTSEVYVITSLVTQCTAPDSNGVYVARGFHPEWVQSHCEWLLKEGYITKDAPTTVLRIQVYVSPLGSVHTYEDWVEPLMPTKVIASHDKVASNRVITLDVPTGNALVSIS